MQFLHLSLILYQKMILTNNQGSHLAFHILDALDDDPLSTFVAFPLFDHVLFLLAWVCPRNDAKGGRGREWETRRCGYPFRSSKIGN